MNANYRINTHGQVVHHAANGFTAIGRDNQCVYENCRNYRASGSHHCHTHTR